MSLLKITVATSALFAIFLTGFAIAQDAPDAMPETAMEKLDEVMQPSETPPSLEDIAASDPALAMRKGEDGEADAMVMLSDVLFGFGDAQLEPAALQTLQTVADKLSGVEKLEIKGHTDAIGSDAYNLDLGQQRADVVRNWLIENSDLTIDSVSATGVGEAEPIATNTNADGSDNPTGRAQNRRVEFILPK
ncbi:OmpA family protein [Parasulfitobacter algicola]|uniref:OmpA family protein n=1 Tax=Parasulfitobacter algicola TaxID=2614809 RepID=A0ABX2IXP9_9RHOB|nr:OmpA family protein [Sulfitobacter algicola]NSX55852.1 OmpA family protein [Sulfitobacter algicola]